MHSWGGEVLRDEFYKLKKELKPTYTTYISNPEALLTNYSTFEELTKNYVDGIVTTVRDQTDKEFNMLINEPFKYPFKITSKWKKTLFDNQKKVSIINQSNRLKTEETKSIKVLKSTDYCIDVKYPTKNYKTLPTKLFASFEAKIPSQIHKLKFTKEDILKTQTIAGINVTLMGLKNDCAEIKVQKTDATPIDNREVSTWLKVLAKDKNNKFIVEKNFNNRIIDTLYKELFNKLIYEDEYTNEFAEIFKKEVIRKRKVRRKIYNTSSNNLLYRSISFKGAINEISVIIYDYKNHKIMNFEKEYKILDIKSDYNNQKATKFSSLGIVYDNKINELLNKNYELDENELASKVKITQNPNYDEKRSVLRFKYPNVLSSKLFYNGNRFSKLKEVRFYNKDNKLINIPADSISYELKNKPNLMVDFYYGLIRYDANRFPEVPYYARGTFNIPIAKIKKQTYTKDKLPEDIQIDASVLKAPKIMYGINQAKYPINSYKILIKDDTDQYLKCFIESQTYYSDTLLKSQNIFYYLGKPKNIEIYKITDTQEVDYHFDVKLTRQIYSRFLLFE